MKRIIIFAAALLLSAGAFAQEGKLPQVMDIVTIENNNNGDVFGVFTVKQDGEMQYYLNLGNLGIGDKVVQLLFDPVFKLYIPLGSTIDEAAETLAAIQELYNEPVGTVTEYPGNFAPLLPTETLETVKVTTRKTLFGRRLEFALEREGYIRATSVSKSDFSSLMFNFKLNRGYFSKFDNK